MEHGLPVVLTVLGGRCSTSAPMQQHTIEQVRARRWKALPVAVSILITSPYVASSALAQATLPAAASAEKSEDEPIKMMEFFVAERGASRATNSITAQDAKIALPGVTVEKLLANVPGVNITTSDPWGFYESGNNIRVRSFGISALAVSVDEVPMGSNSSRYGTPAGRIVDNENLSTITVSQGTGDVTTPAFEALGGSIKYYTTNPKKEMALQVKQSFGSYDFRRTFVRVDTGELVPGLTAFVSSSKLSLKTVGVPVDSEADKLDIKLRYVLPKTTLSYSFTWNDRDDFDTSSSLRWDRWRALETGVAYAGYGGATRYSTADRNDLAEFARLGYSVYTTANSTLTRTLMKDYGDKGRKGAIRNTLDSSVNVGDAPNSGYYYYARNGRMDGFSRFIVDQSFSDTLTGKLATYYQHKQYYGTAYQPRSTALSNISSAYRTGSNGAIRSDIWARYAYRDAAGNLVPFGTAGAIPVGYADANKNGIFDVGEKLDASLSVTAFTPQTTYNAAGAITANGHALINPAATTLANAVTAIPGATARDEEFGGFRWGFFPKLTWDVETPFGPHKITGGLWFETDVQNTKRPHYNLFEGSPTGGFLYDQVLFNSYTRHFLTESTMVFLEDVSRYLDDRLTVTVGAKALNVDRSVSGMTDGTLFFQPLDKQYAKNSVTYKDSFLPQAGVSFKVNRQVELFSSYAVNIAAPAQDVITSLGFNQGLKPERATNYDVGVRYSTPTFGATLAVFYNAYEERLLTVPLTAEEQTALGITGVVGTAIYRNVGGIDSQGSELSFDWRTPIKNLRWTGSVAYQQAEFKENLRVSYQSFMANAADPRAKFYQVIPNAAGGTPVFATELQAGKSQGNTPEITSNMDLTYTWKFVDLNFGGQYNGAVWANTMNTERVPAYTVFRTGFTLRGKKGTRFEPFTFSAQADNVFDQYIFRSGAGTGSFDGTVTPDYGRNLTFTLDAKF